MTGSRSTSPPDGTAYDRRPDFLLAMYEQLMADINRHIVVVWQMVSVVGAAIVGLVVADKEGVPTAYATIVALVVIAWVLNNCGGSTLMAILLHAAFDSSGLAMVALFPSTAPYYLPVHYQTLGIAIIYSAAALVLIVATRGDLSYKRYQREVGRPATSGIIS